MSPYFSKKISLLFVIVWALIQADLVTKISPSEFYSELTRNLTVECIYRHENNSNLTFLMSLSLYHSLSTTEPEYKDIVSIIGFDAQIHRYVANDSDFHVSGAINNTAESLLRVTWDFPKVNRTGAYKCEATGLNQTGKPDTSSSIAVVSSACPTTEQVVEEFQKLTRVVEQHQSHMGERNRVFDQSEYTIKRLSQKVEQLQFEVKTVCLAKGSSEEMIETFYTLLGQIKDKVITYTCRVLATLNSYFEKC